MTAKVLKLQIESRQLSLRDAYRNGVTDGWNALIDAGQIDFASARTMTGFFTAATIAFRIAGDEPAAALMEGAAQRLMADWRSLESCVSQLVAQLDALDGQHEETLDRTTEGNRHDVADRKD